MSNSPPPEKHAAQTPTEQRDYQALQCTKCKLLTPHWTAVADPGVLPTCAICGTKLQLANSQAASPVAPVTSVKSRAPQPQPAPAALGPERIGALMTREDRVQVVNLALGGIANTIAALSWCGDDLDQLLPHIADLAKRCIMLPYASAQPQPAPDDKHQQATAWVRGMLHVEKLSAAVRYDPALGGGGAVVVEAPDQESFQIPMAAFAIGVAEPVLQDCVRWLQRKLASEARPTNGA